MINPPPVPPRKPRLRLREVENQALRLFEIFEERSDFGKLFLAGNEFTINQEFIYKRGQVLGNGIGGKVFETNLEGMLIARKDIEIRTQNSEQELKNYLREVEATRECTACPFIVQYFGYYIHKCNPNLNIYIFMEKMPMSGSHLISKLKKQREIGRNSKIPEYVLGRIVCSVVHALKFLKENLNEPYTVKSDFWALGITVVELATLRNPYFREYNAEEHDVLYAVLHQPSPTLNKDEFSSSLILFLARILEKNQSQRPTFDEIEKLQFFVDHDIPFSFIGTGTRPRRGDGDPKKSIPRLSVGQWLDELFLEND